MNVIAYVRHSLIAAARVASFDKAAIDDFDNSYTGFFLSFAAMIVSVPLYLLQTAAVRFVMAGAGNVVPPVEPGTIVLDLFYFAMAWLAFPLVMIAIAPLINARPRYVPFIIVHNWAGCIVLAAQSLPSLFVLAGLPWLATATFIPLLGFALVYLWQVAREGLQVTPLTAVGIVILELLITVLFEQATMSPASAT